jgi:hypothetical protein
MTANRGSRNTGNTVDNFNRIAYGLTPFDAVARLGFLVATETGAMFYDLLSFIRARIEGNGNHVHPTYAKVLIAVEQVHRTDIPYLMFKPRCVEHLTGLLASLNTEIVCARGSTSPIALRVMEAGFPQEMGEIAAVIDDAIGRRGSSGQVIPTTTTGRRGFRPGPTQSR